MFKRLSKYKIALLSYHIYLKRENIYAKVLLTTCRNFESFSTFYKKVCLSRLPSIFI